MNLEAKNTESSVIEETKEQTDRVMLGVDGYL